MNMNSEKNIIYDVHVECYILRDQWAICEAEHPVYGKTLEDIAINGGWQCTVKALQFGFQSALRML